MNKYATQGALLVDYIRRHRDTRGKWPTYLDLQKLCVSTCVHKRLAEPSAQRALRKGERLVRGKDSEGRVTFMIVRAK